jgi:hypothetical protein
MLKTAVAAAILVMILMGTAGAQEIKLKQSNFWGWRYSTDGGVTYHDVGTSARGLFKAIGDNETARREIDKYCFYRQQMTMTGIIGGGMILLPILDKIINRTGSRWTGTHTAFLLNGISFGLVSVYMGNSAIRHLRRGVNTHNETQVHLLPADASGKVKIMISLRFRLPDPPGGWAFQRRRQDP